MPKKAKHAFGASDSIEAAKLANKIDSFDILFLDGDTEPKVGWLDANGEVRIVETEKVVHVGDSLPESGEEGKIYIFGEDGYFWNGKKFVNLCKPTDVSALEEEIATKVTVEEVKTIIKESEDSSVEIVEF